MTSKEDESFVVAFVTNVLLALLFLALFVICRKLFPKIYQPRCDGSPLAPPPPPKSLFGWFLTTIRYSDEKLLVTHGLDAVMFIKFIKMMICITICMSLYGFVVLFAVNATGENTKTPTNEDESALHVGGLNSLTLSGVETRSTRLIAHLFAVIINSLIVYYFSFTMYRTYMHLRLRFKSTREKIENYSVMVRGVPKTIDDESLKSFFDELFPGKVVSVIRAYSTEKIDKKIEKRHDYKLELEKAYATHMISGERPTCRDKYLIGEVVDSFNWYQREFDKLTTDITRMQDNKLQRACVVFVVFNNIATAAQCSQILLDTKTTFLPEPAPEPRDLIWKNFYIDHHQFMIRKVILNLLFLGLVFFWTFPVVFISGLSNLENLSKVKGFGFLVDVLAWSPVITGFIQGFLPTLVYIIFFAILVKIITFMVTMSGVYTHSKVSRVVTTKYFAFKVVNTLLIYSISGSIIGVLEDFIGKEGMSFGYIVDLLANSLPKQSGFFINLIMLYSLSGHTKALWNPVFLILTYLKQRFLCKTAREYREAERPIPFKYAEAYTMHLLVFTILLTYSTLAPFIMIFGVLYFLMAFVSDKYNLIYVNFPLFEGGGKHWHDVFYRMYAGTILYQVLLVGVFSIYKFVPGAIVSGACVVMTLIFQWYTRSQFVRTCNYLPQRYAARRDEDLNEESSKSDLLRVTSFPSIKMEIDSEPGNEKPFGPKLPIYEKNRMNVTNVTAHQFYFQPSLVPLDDKPEFALSKGKKPAAIIKDEWVSTNDVQLNVMEAGETKQQGVPDLEEERMDKEMEMMEKMKREKKGRGPAGEITESSPLAEKKRYIGEDEDEDGVN